jgi:hypothetical protein
VRAPVFCDDDDLDLAFLVALCHGALKFSASSAAIGTQWCVSEEGILS